MNQTGGIASFISDLTTFLEGYRYILDKMFDAVFFSLTTADVLSEEAILKWYTESHVAKGKSVFLEQMKKFVEWLKNAEEGKIKTLK